jgi:hypothetical protein
MHPDTSYVGTEQIRIETLDSQAAEHLSPSSVVGLKLEVQGYEDEVLVGDLLFLDSTHVVETGSELSTASTSRCCRRWLPGVIVHVHDIYSPSLLPLGFSGTSGTGRRRRCWRP